MNESKLPVAIAGKVTKFAGHGRKLGYPTANITTPAALEDGIYFGYADLKAYHLHPALIFVGTPVTIGDTVRRVEAHLLDIPDEDYYDELLTLEISFFYRRNKKLDSVEALTELMKHDEADAREWFAQHPLASAGDVANT